MRNNKEFFGYMNNDRYLTEQIITYLGNKRSLLGFIDEAVTEVKRELGKEKLHSLDLFSGSGIVARYLKTISSKLYVNDLEGYSNRINHCYLMNKSEFSETVLQQYFDEVLSKLKKQGLRSGFIAKMYSPKDDTSIQPGERVFYTTRNAKYIDSVRRILGTIPEPYQTLLMGPLLYEASVKTNTAGFFKAFYKNSETNIGQFGGNGRNALGRILADINLQLPVLSDVECEYTVFQQDANILVHSLPKVDLAYLDPPYNQHPYGANYFILNLINDYQKPTVVSEVSGIPTNWNKSNFNKKTLALKSMRELCENLNATYILISFNSDGFISLEEMTKMLSAFGSVKVFTKEYNTFRGCRNLCNRAIRVKEYLYLLKKEEL